MLQNADTDLAADTQYIFSHSESVIHRHAKGLLAFSPVAVRQEFFTRRNVS
jgi:hypothetical protein